MDKEVPERGLKVFTEEDADRYFQRAPWPVMHPNAHEETEKMDKDTEYLRKIDQKKAREAEEQNEEPISSERFTALSPPCFTSFLTIGKLSC